MGFVLGTESERTVFHDDVVEYVAAGQRHLVDTDSPLYRADSVFGYAVCGRSVRCWPDLAVARTDVDAPFDAACLAAYR